MKKTLFLLILLFLNTTLSSEEKSKIAVLDLEAKNISADKAATMSAMIRNDLMNTAKFTILDKAEMDKVLNEKGFKATECSNPQCAVEAGKFLNVRSVLVGTFSLIDKKLYISVRAIDVRSGTAIFSYSGTGKTNEELIAASKAIAGKMTLADVGKLEKQSGPEPEQQKNSKNIENEKGKEPQTLYHEFVTPLNADGSIDTGRLWLQTLGGKLGIGANVLGGHVRLGLGSNFLVEFKAQFDEDNILAAARVDYYYAVISGKLPILLYGGVEGGVPFSNLLTQGYEAGVFTGAEVLATNNIGVGADIGAYYFNLSSDLGSINDIGIIINVAVTLYF